MKGTRSSGIAPWWGRNVCFLNYFFTCLNCILTYPASNSNSNSAARSSCHRLVSSGTPSRFHLKPRHLRPSSQTASQREPPDDDNIFMLSANFCFCFQIELVTPTPRVSGHPRLKPITTSGKNQMRRFLSEGDGWLRWQESIQFFMKRTVYKR